MSIVINKTTLQLIRSANTPDYPTENWFVNPVLPDCDQKYWIVRDGALSEMNTAEKKAIEDTLAEFVRKAEKTVLIDEKLKSIGVEALKVDGVLDSNGDIIGG